MKKMQKKILSILTILILTIFLGRGTFVEVINAEGDTNSIFNYEIVNGEIIIKGLKEDIKESIDLIIPETLNNYPITQIGDNSFKNNEFIKSLFISQNVKKIGDYAFSNNVNLKSVEFDENSQLMEIGKFAFSGGLSIEAQNPDLFYNDDYIGEGLYFENIKLPNSLEKIDDYAFYNNDGLLYLEIPENVSYLGAYSIAACDSLRYVKVGNGVEKINDYAFYGNMKLTEVYLGEKISSFGDYAFYFCVSLDTINIPPKVSVIKNTVFLECPSLVTIEGESESFAEKYAGENRKYFQETREISPKNENQLDDTLWSDVYKYAITAQNEIMIIKFDENKKSPSSDIIIPNYIKGFPVTSIAANAFMNDTYITGVKLSKNIVKTGTGAFANYKNIKSNLKNVIFENNSELNKIGIGMFYTQFPKNSSLEKIDIPKKVFYLGGQAFFNNVNLKEISIPASINKIDSEVFYGCDALETIVGEKDTFAESYATQKGYVFKEFGYDHIDGDVDGNGTINAVDLVVLKEYILMRIDDSIAVYSDINRDGKVTAVDMVCIVQIILNS